MMRLIQSVLSCSCIWSKSQPLLSFRNKYNWFTPVIYSLFTRLTSHIYSHSIFLKRKKQTKWSYHSYFVCTCIFRCLGLSFVSAPNQPGMSVWETDFHSPPHVLFYKQLFISRFLTVIVLTLFQILSFILFLFLSPWMWCLSISWNIQICLETKRHQLRLSSVSH